MKIFNIIPYFSNLLKDFLKFQIPNIQFNLFCRKICRKELFAKSGDILLMQRPTDTDQMFCLNGAGGTNSFWQSLKILCHMPTSSWNLNCLWNELHIWRSLTLCYNYGRSNMIFKPSSCFRWVKPTYNHLRYVFWRLRHAYCCSWLSLVGVFISFHFFTWSHF